MKFRTNAKDYLKENFPDLLHYKITTSRMYEAKDRVGYHDNWWFKFMYSDLENYDYIIFVGALDYSNKDFRVFKIPSKYILLHINELDMNAKGWTNIYLQMNSLEDLRHTKGLSFKDFELKK